MKAKISIEKPDWELVARYLARETSTAEQEAVEKWADQSKKNNRDLMQAKVLFKKTDEYYRIKHFNTDEAWQKTQQHLSHQILSVAPRENTRKIFISTFYKYAAIVIVAILVGTAGYWFGFKNHLSGVYSEIRSSEKQVVNEYILPDGSVVALNSNSTLIFPKKFKNNMREVTITGEAYFDVHPDPNKPFIINVGNAQVKVLGTSFNVCAYPGNETIEVVVETGIVQVSCHNEAKPEEPLALLLNAGEKGTLLHSLNKLEKTINTDANYIAWKTHNLVFDQTPLQEVIHYLNKAYHSEIQLNGKNLENLVLTAQFENKSIDFILNVVQITFGLQLEHENGVYTLSENKTLNN
jgi:ferric-dicitrate binding protein FerR (iron transport regulator)